MRLVVNVGGPDRVSRSEMAQIVAACKGHKSSLIRLVSASSVSRCRNQTALLSCKCDFPKKLELVNLNGIRLNLMLDFLCHFSNNFFLIKIRSVGSRFRSN